MREIAPFGVRMRPELKARLEAVAKANGRSLNAEVIARLMSSLERTEPAGAKAEQNTSEYRVSGNHERDMLALFRSWTTEKQMAFLVLFK